MTEVVECLKLVAKRAHAPPIWNNLRRRVKGVEESRPLMKWEVYDRSEEVVNVNKMNVNGNVNFTRLGSRRNRKVSSVTSAEYGSEAVASVVGVGGDRIVRSKSVGYFSEIKVGSDSNLGPTNPNRTLLTRKKPGLAVKMPVMRLSKSRSMGVLQSPRLVHYNSKGYVVEFEEKAQVSNTGFDMSKLLINLDEKSENEMLEKPLVSL
jgi:hypothetical protein